MCGVKMQRKRQRRRTGNWSVDSILVYPKSRCCIFNRFHLISDLFSYLVSSSFNLYHQWLAGHYQASSIRRERGAGGLPPSLLFVAANIFLKFTYRKLNLGGVGQVTLDPPPTFKNNAMCLWSGLICSLKWYKLSPAFPYWMCYVDWCLPTYVT